MLLEYKNREIEVQVSGEANESIYIEHAFYTDTHEELTEEECEEVLDLNHAALNQYLYECLIDYAEYMIDSDR